MPVTRLEIGEWLPDQGEWANPGLYKINNLVSYGGRVVAPPAFVPIITYAEIAAAYSSAGVTNLGFEGLHIHTDHASGGTVYYVVGGIGSIFSANKSGGTATINVTGGFATMGKSAQQFRNGWQFASYGDYVYATHGALGLDRISRSDMSSTFADAIVYTSPDSYRFWADYMFVIKNHLFLANCKPESVPTGSALVANTHYPSLVAWSATDNPTRFGDPASTPNAALIGSDYQDLSDGNGPITGGVGGDYGYVFKQNAIYRVDGPPFQFRPVVQGAGTVMANSIVRFYDDIYYLGPSGPTRLRAGSSVPEPLGYGKVSNTLFETMNPALVEYTLLRETELFFSGTTVTSYKDLTACADYRRGLILWTSPSGDGSTSICIVYDTTTGRFSSFNVSGALKFVRSLPFNETNSVNTQLGVTTYGQSSIFDRVAMIDNSSTTTAIYNTYADSSSGSLSEPDATWVPSFTTPFVTFSKENEYNTTRVLKLRIPHTLRRNSVTPGDGDPAAKLVISVTVRSKSRFDDEYHSTTATYDSSSSYQNPDGWIEFNESTYGTHHQFVVSFTATTTSASAQRWIAHLRDLGYLEVEFAFGSKYGAEYHA